MLASLKSLGKYNQRHRRSNDQFMFFVLAFYMLDCYKISRNYTF